MADRATEARQRAEAQIRAATQCEVYRVSLDEPATGRPKALADDVLWLLDERDRLTETVDALTDAALPVVISYENCKAHALAIGQEWIGVPDVEALAAALSAEGRKPA